MRSNCNVMPKYFTKKAYSHLVFNSYQHLSLIPAYDHLMQTRRTLQDKITILAV